MLVNGLLREQFGFYALCVLIGGRRSESFLTLLFSYITPSTSIHCCFGIGFGT